MSALRLSVWDSRLSVLNQTLNIKWFSSVCLETHTVNLNGLFWGRFRFKCPLNIKCIGPPTLNLNQTLNRLSLPLGVKGLGPLLSDSGQTRRTCRNAYETGDSNRRSEREEREYPMIEDATKTSNQTSLRPARLEDLSRLGEGWEYETAGGKRWRFDRRTMGGQVCFSEEGQTQRLRKLELPWAIEHGLLYCPVEEPKPLECEGTLLKVGSNVTMYMGEAWAGKRVKVMEVREGEDIVRLPKGSTVLGPEASDAVARFRQANGIWEAHKATYSLDQVDPEDWMSVDHELHEDAGRAFFALSAFLCPTQE